MMDDNLKSSHAFTVKVIENGKEITKLAQAGTAGAVPVPARRRHRLGHRVLPRGPGGPRRAAWEDPRGPQRRGPRPLRTPRAG